MNASGNHPAHSQLAIHRTRAQILVRKNPCSGRPQRSHASKSCSGPSERCLVNAANERERNPPAQSYLEYNRTSTQILSRHPFINAANKRHWKPSESLRLTNNLKLTGLVHETLLATPTVSSVHRTNASGDTPAHLYLAGNMAIMQILVRDPQRSLIKTTNKSERRPSRSPVT